MEANEDLVTGKTRHFMEELITKLGVKNYTMDISAGTVRGENFLGIIAKVQVKGRDKDDKSTVLNFIVKSAPRNDTFRIYAAVHEIYDREIYVYSKVFPEFIKFQEEKEIMRPFRSVAAYYNSILDDTNEALILKDMKVQGFQLRSRHEPLNYNHVLLIMKELGKFHAVSYALRDQKQELFQELSDNMQEAFFTVMKSDEMHKSFSEQSIQALKALDPIKDKIAYDKFRNFQDKMVGVVEEAVSSKTAGKYAVFVHGDCWMNNILFKYENPAEPHSPSQICFLDWQLSHLGSPALDLSYFLFTCTDQEFRNKHYEQLIKEYYKSLSSFLTEFGSDYETLFPFGALQEHLRMFSVYGLYMAILVLFVMTSEAEDIPDHTLTTDRFKYESRNLEKYNSKISGVIKDFVKYGYEF